MSRSLLYCCALAALFIVILPATALPVELNEETFLSIARKPDKVVFVLFYAKWCDRCVKALSEWDKLSREASAGVLIAQFDVEKNPNFGRKYLSLGLPHARLFRFHDEDGVAYSGDSTVEAYLSWLDDKNFFV